MIDENAAITLLELKDLKKFSGFEQDLNPQPLHYRCNALPTELSVGLFNSFMRACAMNEFWRWGTLSGNLRGL